MSLLRLITCAEEVEQRQCGTKKDDERASKRHDVYAFLRWRARRSMRGVVNRQSGGQEFIARRSAFVSSPIQRFGLRVVHAQRREGRFRRRPSLFSEFPLLRAVVRLIFCHFPTSDGKYFLYKSIRLARTILCNSDRVTLYYIYYEILPTRAVKIVREE